MRTRPSLLLAGLLVVLHLGLHLACRQPPEPPRGVDENPPVEDIVEETVEPAPESARVLVENDWLAVTEVRLAPGARLTLHRDGDRVVYAHTGQSLRFTPRSAPDRTSVRSFAAGEAGRVPSGALTVENTGPPEARFLTVTRSSQPSPVLAGRGPGLAGAVRSRELFRDRQIAVSALTLEAGASLSVPDAPLEVIQILGPGELRVETEGDETEGDETEIETGDSGGPITTGGGPVRIVAGRYRVTNPGRQPVRVVVFSFRS